MAFDRFTYGRILSSALGIIAGSRTGVDYPADVLATRLRRMYPEAEGGTPQAFTGLARAASNAAKYAAELNRRRNEVPERGDHTVNPRIGPDDPRYEYRTIARLVDTDGNVSTRQLYITSDTPLSVNAMRELAFELIDADGYASDRYIGPRQRGTDIADVQVVLQFAGRRG